MQNCKFCGDLDTTLIIDQSTFSLIIANYYPMGIMSLLAIPKRHIASITEMTIEENADIMQLIVKTVTRIKEKLNPEGINVFLNEGAIAGQSISHVHFHIVARKTDDGLENFHRKEGPKKAISIIELNKLKTLLKP